MARPGAGNHPRPAAYSKHRLVRRGIDAGCTPGNDHGVRGRQRTRDVGGEGEGVVGSLTRSNDGNRPVCFDGAPLPADRRRPALDPEEA